MAAERDTRVARVTSADLHGRELPENLSYRIGGRIQALREQQGLSQREAAELLGISQPALSKLESGKNSPSLATLLRLLAVYRLDTVETLLGTTPSRKLAEEAYLPIAVEP